jgi:hypothetical protein
MPDAPKPSLPPSPLVAIAGWLIPGAGYFLINQRARAITVCIAILSLFTLGLLIGGIRVVQAPDGATPERILQRPWFIPQILAGPIAVAADYTAGNWGSHVDTSTRQPRKGAPASTSRVNEIGTLYTAVAGLLNLMAVIDSAYRAGNRGGR